MHFYRVTLCAEQLKLTSIVDSEGERLKNNNINKSNDKTIVGFHATRLVFTKSHDLVALKTKKQVLYEWKKGKHVITIIRLIRDVFMILPIIIKITTLTVMVALTVRTTVPFH